MATKGSTRLSVVVRVEPGDEAYDVVLDDGDELVLAHYDTLDGEGRDEARAEARADAERYAAEVRRLLRAG